MPGRDMVARQQHFLIENRPGTTSGSVSYRANCNFLSSRKRGRSKLARPRAGRKRTFDFRRGSTPKVGANLNVTRGAVRGARKSATGAVQCGAYERFDEVT